jgi:phage protein D
MGNTLLISHDAEFIQTLARSYEPTASVSEVQMIINRLNSIAAKIERLDDAGLWK